MNYEHYLNIADLIVRVDAPYPMILGERMEPFAAEKAEADIFYQIVNGEFEIAKLPLKYESERYRVYETKDRYYRVRKQSEWVCLLERKKQDWRMSVLRARRELGGLLFLNFVAMEEPLLLYNALFIHASLVRWQGRGILFTAPSGTGKSTQAKLWEKYLGAEVLNGDQPIIRRQGDTFTAYGSMFAGSSDIYKNESAEVTAIIVLEQSEHNRLRALHGAEAFQKIYGLIFTNPWNSEFVNKVTEEVLLLLQHIPVYLLQCRPDQEAVELVREEIERIEDDKK